MLCRPVPIHPSRQTLQRRASRGVEDDVDGNAGRARRIVEDHHEVVLVLVPTAPPGSGLQGRRTDDRCDVARRNRGASRFAQVTSDGSIVANGALCGEAQKPIA